MVHLHEHELVITDLAKDQADQSHIRESFDYGNIGANVSVTPHATHSVGILRY